MQMMAQHFPPEGGVSSFVYFFLATQIANDKMIQLIFFSKHYQGKKIVDSSLLVSTDFSRTCLLQKGFKVKMMNETVCRSLILKVVFSISFGIFFFYMYECLNFNDSRKR